MRHFARFDALLRETLAISDWTCLNAKNIVARTLGGCLVTTRSHVGIGP
jgi:hypothetical protein